MLSTATCTYLLHIKLEVGHEYEELMHAVYCGVLPPSSIH